LNPRTALTDEERLNLQQLRLADWSSRRGDAPELSANREAAESGDLPDIWNLTQGLSLASWQRDARDAWLAAGGRGTIKVVTGAGKTVVALSIAETLQTRDPSLRVAVVVPTIVLMQQWVETLHQRGNLPAKAIGMLGGGHSDGFDGDRRILVAVLASARKDLASIVTRAQVGDHLLFVADECHRVGAPEMSAVLETPRHYSLGLSATPERDDDATSPDTFSQSTVGSALGNIVYEMSFADAVRLQVLPPFDIHHYGISLATDEAKRYEALSRSISDARKELIASSPTARAAGGGEKLMAWARNVSARGSSQIAGIASRFVNDTSRRKQLLYRASNRLIATSRLVSEAMLARPDARVILFHESIDEVTIIFAFLRGEGMPVVMEHSDLPTELREASLELFRTGIAQIVVSAKSLIEGFNVPEADLGIIVASSSSARQRIQSIGRVLRRYRTMSGEEKASRVCVLYVRDSVDDRIYEKEDWDRLVGVGRNRFFFWDIASEPIEQDGPPRQPAPRETDIDLDVIRPGDPYPGRYEGAEFSVDASRNVKDPEGRVALNPSDVPALIRRIKGQSGRFRITPQKKAILVRLPVDEDSWETVFAGRLKDDFRFSRPEGQGIDFDARKLATGDDYPGPVEPADELRFRQRGGGVLAKRVRGGEAFARGTEADRLVAAILSIGPSGQVSRVLVNGMHHAFWWDEGQPRFLIALSGDLEFPAMENRS
jgi:superfamily II DNA or RNA helicase